jgi:hypothetical protein
VCTLVQQPALIGTPPRRGGLWLATGAGKPVEALSLGIVEVLHDDRVVAVGRVSLTNDRDDTIDFGACASVQPAPGNYVLRLASG